MYCFIIIANAKKRCNNGLLFYLGRKDLTNQPGQSPMIERYFWDLVEEISMHKCIFTFFSIYYILFDKTYLIHWLDKEKIFYNLMLGQLLRSWWRDPLLLLHAGGCQGRLHLRGVHPDSEHRRQTTPGSTIIIICVSFIKGSRPHRSAQRPRVRKWRKREIIFYTSMDINIFYIYFLG